MKFNLVNDQEQVAQFVRRGIAWRSISVALALGFVAGGCLKRFVAWGFIGLWGACPGRFRAVLVVSGSFAYYTCACAWPRGFGLAQRSVWWRSCAF